MISGPTNSDAAQPIPAVPGGPPPLSSGSSRLQAGVPSGPRQDRLSQVRAQLHKLTRPLVTLFILFHLVFIAVWALPLSNSLTHLPRKFISPYFSWLGLHQEWALFAPNPIAANSYVNAQVTLENGDLRTWDFPQLEKLGFKERYSKARYRKYVGWLYRRGFNYAWPDAARYIARQFKDSAIRPRTVKLIRHWALIPPITLADDSQPIWRSTVFFVYQVQPGDLQ